MNARAWVVLLAVGCGAEPVTTEPVASALEGAVEVKDVGSNPGGLRFFLVKPASVTTPTGLVVALHGCAQRAADFQQVGLDRLAERDGFLVLYPQTSAATGCFRWFDPNDTTRGRGELASLENAIARVVQREGVPPGRVFITGLSAGAAMAAAAMAAAPELFEAGAVFAGVPAGCAKTMSEGLRCQVGVDETPQTWARAVMPGSRLPRVQVWTGTLDTTVSPSMAKELVEQWTAAHGLDVMPEHRESFGRISSEEHHRDGGLVVQQVLVEGMGHAVPVAPGKRCGRSAPFISDVDVCAAEQVVRFFGLSSDVTIEPAAPLDAGTAIDAGLPADAGVACTSETALPWFHLVAGRGTRCGFWSTLVCAKGSGELLGASASSLPVTASSFDGVTWSAGPCPR